MEQIEPQDKTMAVIAHLSGLAGYLVPLGGALAPIVIMLTSSSKTVAAIAKQALLLNVLVYVGFFIGAAAYFTMILIPCAAIWWLVLAGAALVLPLIGAIKASESQLYRYPVVKRFLPSSLP